MPSLLCQIQANFKWNTDSGTTSHMTPHKHWIHNYQLFHTPICLANDLIVYLAGIGSVVFVPTVRGRKTWAVEFSQVLHVPELKANLLSILYLTCQKQFTVPIDLHEMRFMHNGMLLFTTQINENNTAFLDGATEANLEAANSISTVPLNISLLHCCFVHHDYNSVKHMISKELVTGLNGC